MTRVIVSTRGYINAPTLVEIDLESQKILRTLEFTEIECGGVPDSKVGFSGLAHYKDYLIAAAWDKVCFINSQLNIVEEVVTHNYFTDLHGLYVDNDGVIWVTSTNVDGLYTIQNGKVEPVWHTWGKDELGCKREWIDKDFRKVIKEDSPFHHYHVNDVFTTERYIFLSFLGKRKSLSRLHKLLVKLHVRPFRVSPGGIFVLDRYTKKLIRTLHLEGLHDSHLGLDHHIYYTEYFGNALIQLNTDTLTIKRIPLEIESYKTGGYLSRGVLQTENGFWVGHTMFRGWHQEQPFARIRNYSANGEWLQSEIRLPNLVGIYAIVKHPSTLSGAQSGTTLR